MRALLQLFKIKLFVCLLVLLPACSFDKNIEITQLELSKPDAVIAALQGGIGPERQKSAEKYYLKAKKAVERNNVGAAFKLYAVSVMDYPSVKAYKGLIKTSSNSHYSKKKMTVF